MPKRKKKVYYNKHGVKIDYSLIQKGQKYQQQINNQRKMKREKIYKKEYVRESQLGMYSSTVGETQRMGQTSFDELNDVRFNPDAYTSQARLKKRVQQLQKMTTKKYQQQQQRQYKENLLNGYDTVFDGKIDDKKLQRLKNLTKRISSQDLEMLHYTSDIGDLDYIYGQAKYTTDIDDIEEVFNNQLLIIEKEYHKRYVK